MLSKRIDGNRRSRKQHWYEPRCKTYTKLFKVLGNCRQPEQASLLFELMLSEGLKPTIDVYTSLISVYGKCELLESLCHARVHEIG
ncbi:hypothetical protein Bca52824_000306 [Brassica carinata]|uniref:Pentatricopeptide repeat-containing protein n=1 Tax=Brassica carinata TaxID=52824 RepID=A0A8X7WGK3_BRACI|nr:hypothetical protein Bca52824_000306 [Brassica carinata]